MLGGGWAVLFDKSVHTCVVGFGNEDVVGVCYQYDIPKLIELEHTSHNSYIHKPGCIGRHLMMQALKGITTELIRSSYNMDSSDSVGS